MRTRTNSTKVCLMLMCAGAAGASGCFKNRAASAKVARTISIEHPIVPVAAGATLEPPPEIRFELPAPVPQLAVAHSQPARPRAPTVVAPDHTNAGKASVPTIVPELSADELADAKIQTQMNLDQAEKRLASLTGRNLNAAQADLASKVRGFADGAREAMKTGDWTRAKNLSQKAVVLADELAANL